MSVRFGRLVQSGPYRYIRHPGYTGALVSFFGMWAFLGLRPLSLLWWLLYAAPFTMIMVSRKPRLSWPCMQETVILLCLCICVNECGRAADLSCGHLDGCRSVGYRRRKPPSTSTLARSTRTTAAAHGGCSLPSSRRACMGLCSACLACAQHIPLRLGRAVRTTSRVRRPSCPRGTERSVPPCTALSAGPGQVVSVCSLKRCS